MRILFQGDSITDAGRDRSNPHDLGTGYPKYAAQYIREQHPGMDLEFLDLGISGNQTKDLVARWQADCVDLKPDLVSIHIGVNDTWHHAPNRDWILDAQYEANYRSILTDIKQKTSAKILILEQFLLPVPDKEFFRIDLDVKIGITRKLARDFADIFIPVDGLFAAACVEKDMYYWSPDGVHPNENGSAFMGKVYAEAFVKLFG